MKVTTKLAMEAKKEISANRQINQMVVMVKEMAVKTVTMFL